MIPAYQFFSENNSISSSTSDNRTTGQLRLAGKEYIQVISNSATSTAAANMQGGWWQELQIDRGICNELRAIAAGFYLQGGTGLINLSKNYTYKVSVFVLYQNKLLHAPIAITWSGSNTITITPAMAPLESDNWCILNGNIPNGARVFIYYDLVTPTSGIITIHTHSGIGNNSAIPYSVRNYSYPSTPPKDIYSQYAGLIDSTGGTSVSSTPVGILGIVAKHEYDYSAAFMMGHSRVAGDTAGVDITNDKVNGRSAIWRVLNDFDVPIYAHCVGGCTLNTLVNSMSNNAYAMTKYCTDAFVMCIVNDVNAGRSLAQIQADFATAITRLRAANSTIRIWWITEYPETDDSASNWLSPATQTPRGGDSAKWGVGGILDQANAWLLTRVGIELHAVLDPREIFESGGAGTSMKWAAGSATQQYTKEGVHLNDVGSFVEAAFYKSELIAKGFIPNNVR